MKTVLVEAEPGALRDALHRALAGHGATVDGAEAAGPVDGYVHVGPWGSPPPARPFADVTDEELAAGFERPLLALVESFHRVHPRLARPGGQVVVVIPTAAMAGAPGLAVTAALAEAQRQLAKSTARQWGADGVRVNVVAADLSALAPAAAGLPSVSLSPPALGPDAVRDLDGVARLVAVLATGGVDALTGATLSADGGIWMAP